MMQDFSKLFPFKFIFHRILPAWLILIQRKNIINSINTKIFIKKLEKPGHKQELLH